jgi:hypothetical protein
LNFCGIDLAGEFGAHEKARGLVIDEFVVADDVAAVAKEHAGDVVDQARAIAAFD